jgi:hypothetical protein
VVLLFYIPTSKMWIFKFILLAYLRQLCLTQSHIGFLFYSRDLFIELFLFMSLVHFELIFFLFFFMAEVTCVYSYPVLHHWLKSILSNYRGIFVEKPTYCKYKDLFLDLIWFHWCVYLSLLHCLYYYTL